MVDRVREKMVEQHTVRVQEDLQRVISDLRHGNIHEVLAKAQIPKAEIHKFFSDQWRQWQSQIVQNYETYAAEGAVPAPMREDFGESNPQNAFSQSDGAVVLAGLMGTSKAMVAKSAEPAELPVAEAAASAAAPLSLGELEQMAEGTLQEWDNFMGDMWSQILDAQMLKDYEARMSEIKAEVERLIALAKSGAIGPEFVLLALAKVNVTKNGVLFAWLGKKSFGINEQMQRASADLQGISPTDPQYFAALQDMQAKTRDGSFQLNMLTTDMQKVMQDISSTLESVKGMMDLINQTRREIIGKIQAR